MVAMGLSLARKLAELLDSPSDARYEAARSRFMRIRSRVMLAYVGIAYPAFYALDLFVYGERWQEFGAIRAAHMLVALTILGMSPRWFGTRGLLLSARCCALSATTCVALMCALTEGFQSLYIVGMIICFLAISTIEVFPPSALISSLLVVSLTYIILNLTIAHDTDLRHIVPSTAFVVGAVLFCSVSAILSEKYRRDLFEATERLAERNQQLEVAREHQTQFLNTVSHELRSPVNSILGFVELVETRETALDVKSRANLVRVRESGRKLLGFINDLLDLAKAEAGRMEIKLSTFDLMPVVLEVAEATRALVLNRDLEVVVQGPPSLIVRSDPDRLGQILTNLASNAAKFTEQGQVTLSVSNETEVVLEVTDTGPGIPVESRAVIFEAFRQVGISAGGTGLGLCIVQHLVNLMSGTIELDSEVGKGSTFRVRLGRVATERAA